MAWFEMLECQKCFKIQYPERRHQDRDCDEGGEHDWKEMFCGTSYNEPKS